MKMTDETQKIIEDIEHDYRYYKNMGFEILASKFERDLNLIKELIKKEGEENGQYNL